MRILSYSFETTLQMDGSVSDHDFVLRCEPQTTVTQTVISAQTVLAPSATLARQHDGFGNLIQVGRISEPHDTFSFVSTGLVMVDARDERPQVAHPIYARPSRFTGMSDGLAAFAGDVLRVQANAAPLTKASMLSRALHERMEYAPGSTTVATTAAEAYAQGTGVCQDYAHILIALLRAQGIPARYVVGLMIGEGATHAWAEIHDGIRWRGVDPTNDRAVDDTYITIAHGRDFADCPIEAGVFRGGVRQEQQVSVIVENSQ